MAAGMPAPAGLESHLASCPDCREELAGLRRALALADAEMAVLLSAEPSPGLAARIRRSLAESEHATEWRFGWLWPATAAAAVMLVALAVWLGRSPSPAPVTRATTDPLVIPRDSPSPGPEGSTRFAGSSSPGTSRATGDDRAVARRRPPALTRAIAGEPEVLVPPGEAEALLRFASLVNRRAVAPDSLLVADLSAPLPEPNAIEIAPLEIVPLDPAETSGTD